MRVATVLVFAALAVLGLGVGALNVFHAMSGETETPAVNAVVAVICLTFGAATLAFAGLTLRQH